MKKVFHPIIITLICTAILSSCAYDKEVAQVPCVISNNVSFTAAVAPVIQANCFSCHNNSFRLGNVTLEGFDNIKKAAASGKLFNVINHSPGFPKMPKSSNKLDDCTIATVKKWIDNGTPNN